MSYVTFSHQLSSTTSLYRDIFLGATIIYHVFTLFAPPEPLSVKIALINNMLIRAGEAFEAIFALKFRIDVRGDARNDETVPTRWADHSLQVTGLAVLTSAAACARCAQDASLRIESGGELGSVNSNLERHARQDHLVRITWGNHERLPRRAGRSACHLVACPATI